MQKDMNLKIEVGAQYHQRLIVRLMEKMSDHNRFLLNIGSGAGTLCSAKLYVSGQPYASVARVHFHRNSVLYLQWLDGS